MEQITNFKKRISDKSGGDEEKDLEKYISANQGKKPQTQAKGGRTKVIDKVRDQFNQKNKKRQQGGDKRGKGGKKGGKPSKRPGKVARSHKRRNKK